MFLIPFVHRTNSNVHFIYVFLNQGKMFIQEENIEEFLEVNSMFSKKTVNDNDFCYVEIDTEKTDVSSFYNFNESSDYECWRRFVIIENDALHINDTAPEFIKTVLKKIVEL